MKHNSTLLTDIIKAYISSSPPTSVIADQDIQLCTQFGLGPILADLYLQNEDLINNDIKEKLRSIKITAQFYSAQFDSAINELIEELSDSEITVILLKGVHLSKTYYEHHFHRRMGDIDFLIQNKFAYKVSQTLYSLGYVHDENNPDEFYLTHQHLKPFYNSKKNTWIEVHTRLFSLTASQGKRKLFQPQNIFKNISPIEACTGHVYGLAVELNLHYTITHWVKECKFVNSLNQIVDIALLIKKNQVDWDKFINSIESLSHATEIKIVFAMLIEHDLVQIPTKTQQDIFKQKDSAGITGRWVLKKILNGYLYQSKLITKIIGPTNCSTIWLAYQRDAYSLTNHFRALSAFLFTDVPGSNSKLHSLGIRSKRFYRRLVNHNK